MERRGLSAVIATVLILLLTVVAISILAVFVIPFVRNNLDGSTACFDTFGDLGFDESAYNCFNETVSPDGRTGFSVKIDNEKIIGFKVGLGASGSSNVFSVLNGTEGDNNQIRMLGAQFGQNIEIPMSGGVRTYIAKGIFDDIEIFPILDDGTTCDKADSIKIRQCLTGTVDSQQIIDGITEF